VYAENFVFATLHLKISSYNNIELKGDKIIILTMCIMFREVKYFIY